MKFRQITKFLLLFVLAALTISSCSDDEETTTTIGSSSDAQIYSFKLAAKPNNALDSTTYPQIAKTKFSIDQFKLLIYNADSLPYRTAMRKFYATLAFSTSGTSSIHLVYPDTIMEWNKTDSVDFSIATPKFLVTAADGLSKKEYTLDLRVHQVDPDTLIWASQALSLPSTVKQQKTVLKGTSFYTFSIDADNTFYIRKATTTSAAYDNKQAVSGLNANNVELGSITLFKDNFYALDKAHNVYNSTDGINWTLKQSNVLTILGVVPGLASDGDEDKLLVITENNEFATFADYSSSMQIVRALTSTELNGNSVQKGVPFSVFSSSVNFDRKNQNLNMLAVTAGKTKSGVNSNDTWMFRVSDTNVLQVSVASKNSIFAANEGIVTFVYDGYFYALTKKIFYKSGFSFKWAEAPSKEQFVDPLVPNASGQSIIVDDKNYIWIFGGVTGSGSVPSTIWKGRLNKLYTK